MSKLKVGELLSINSREELNELADILGLDIHDAIVVEGEEYVAYIDFDGSVEGSLNVEPLSVYKSNYPQYDKKPRKFKSWIRSLK